jgi:hypothetical protein
VIGTEIKSALTDQKISEALLENGLNKLAQTNEIVLLSDPCDIRKEYSSSLENLGKVRNLDGEIINGYSSFNTVAVNMKDKKITLLGHKVYSNRDSKYVSPEEIEAYEDYPIKCSLSSERYQEIKDLVENNKFINKDKICREQLKQVSNSLKKEGVKAITHVLDREFDDNDFFEFIDSELKDKFVIRLKSSRVTSQKDKNKKSIKLINQNFRKQYKIHYQKLSIKNKHYQDVVVIVEYGNYLEQYSLVRVSILNREGKSLFKQPLLLITNREIDSDTDALLIYHLYLKRAKIEGVFKFLKDILGWEQSQLRDFNSIQNLLSFCYFIAGYFYEIEHALVENEAVQFICELGNSKGKVTKHFILEGLSSLLTMLRVEQAMEKHNITPDKLKNILELLAAGEI